MATDLEAMVLRIEANMRRYEKQWERATQTTDRRARSIETRSRQMSDRIQSVTSAAASKVNTVLGALGMGFLGGFAAGGLQGFISEIRSATKSMGDLKAEAARAGVSATVFQELGYAAKQNNVSIDALTDGLKELQLRADEFVVTGKGSGAEAFQRLGYTADELKTKLRDPSRLFQEIIGRVAALRDTAAGIRIMDEIFGGTGGEQFVRFLEGGEAGIRRNIDQAHKLGQVLDEDVVRKGAELDKKFNQIADTISNRMKGAVVSVADALLDWSTNAETFLNKLGNSSFFKWLADNTAFDWSTTGDVQRLPPSGQAASGGLDPKAVDVLRRAMNAAGGVARDYVPDRSAQLPASFIDPKLAGLKADFQTAMAGFIQAAKDAGHDIRIQSGKRSTERQAQLWADAVRKYGSETEARKWVAPPGRSFHEKGAAADLSYAGAGMKGNSEAARAARLWAHQNAQKYGLTFPLSNEAWHVEPAGQRGGAAAEGDPDTSGLEASAAEKAAAARKKVADAAERQEEKIKRVIEALVLETDQVGKTEQQQRLMQELQEAGVDLTTKEGQAIRDKVAALYELKKVDEERQKLTGSIKEGREELASMGADATKGFIADLRAGVDAGEAFANVLDKITQKLLDMVINDLFATMFQTGQQSSLGGIGSFISSLFGGARAMGGPVSQGRTYLVGERGPELFAPGRSGTIVPNSPDLENLSGGVSMAGGRNVTMSMAIDLRGANGDETIRRISAQAAAEGARRAFEAGRKDYAARRKRFEQLEG